jgi:hypothetical protein
VKAENGPWTERVAGQVYMKLLIAGGNMTTTNVMQIRVMPSPTANARVERGGPRLVRAAYGEPQVTPAMDNAPVTLTSIMEGILGYAVGQGAQALGQVAVVLKALNPLAVTPAEAETYTPPATPPANTPAPSPSDLAAITPAAGTPAPAQAPGSSAPASTAPTSHCPTYPVATSAPLNIFFTSYTDAITSQQLLADYRGLYNAGVTKGLQYDPNFANRMNFLAACGATVGVFVINGKEFPNFEKMNHTAYTAANGKDDHIVVPNDNEIVYMYAVNDHMFEVVLSWQALTNDFYTSNLSFHTDSNFNPIYDPVIEPIEMPLAYELGTNVFNKATNPDWCEEMVQKDTNQFLDDEFHSKFEPNNQDATGSGSYGNLTNAPSYQILPPHLVLNLRDPPPIGAPYVEPKDKDPQTAYNVPPTQPMPYISLKDPPTSTIPAKLPTCVPKPVSQTSQ